ncbi:ABC-type Fe3+-hydroxamate transport system substrate-binding protein [Paenibacillus endophyticus]|uniref:ABC-type Fe3+-hydroxamate transport system substrate-binding protein n=1 Tax=Paenibacillus endophyticus TaxID=1294268 RepID=A0A7W5GB55_9BACL|nr:helix-turn-helix domain-containing protein [Paenibacillus endophyticus]MBB3154014.1 ABC-type Fe3+-hydroxamate transport system substrate-binding protein [Paenibacillus endophyticus]
MKTDKSMKTTEYGSLEDMSFKLREIESVSIHRHDWKLKLQFIESHLLLVAASGQGQLTVDGRFIELRQGSVYLCVPGQLVEAAVDSLDERGFYHIRFDVFADNGQPIPSGSVEDPLRRFPVKGEVIMSSPVTVGTLCETICRHMKDVSPLNRFRGQIHFQELLLTILQDAVLEQETDSEAVLEYVKSYMKQHYQQELTIEHLAKVAGISPRHFMRQFKKRYGCSAIDYLAIYRIEQAQQLMRTGGHYRIRDIARHVGYHDDIYFRRKFKQVSGIPPAAFIKNNKQKIVAYDSFNIGQLLALQVTPSAAPAEHPWTDYYQRKYETSSVLGLSSLHANRLEQLKLAAPDYIIGSNHLVSSGEQKKLNEIAPAFFVPWLENDWRAHLRLTARFLDRSTIAEVWLDHYERKAAFVSDQLKRAFKDDTLLILRITGNSFTLLGGKSIATVFYDDLHIRRAQRIYEETTDQEMTPEQLTAIDPDRMLVIVGDDPQSQSSWHTLMRSERWRSLKAYQNGRIDFLPAYPWIEYNAFTHDLLLDEALKLWHDRT